jgi:hypothetical protein
MVEIGELSERYCQCCGKKVNMEAIICPNCRQCPVSESRDTKLCPFCLETLYERANYCDKCGRNQAQQPAIRQFCMHCGSLQKRDFERCPVCNNPPPSWSEVKICKGCGTKVPKDARFCYLDGGRLELWWCWRVIEIKISRIDGRSRPAFLLAFPGAD